MGTIEETRKLVQDFLAPELREIKARIEALEGTTKTRFDAVQVQFEPVQVQFAALEDTMKSRFDAVDRVIAAQNAMMAAQHSAVMNAIANLENYTALAERLTKLESERGQQAH
jgi:hypothetical protein